VKFKPRRPSPALVLSALALFIALGGTGYATSRLVVQHAPEAHATKSLSKAQINKLIASYVGKHKSQLRGVPGPQGAQGSQGPVGPKGADGVAGTNGKDGTPGPGPIRINSTIISSSSNQPAGTVGPWTITFSCAAGGPASMKITGPGDLSTTSWIASGNNPGTTYVGAFNPIGSGATYAVAVGAQLSQEIWLQNGSSLYQLNTIMTANNGGLFENCELQGDAIPVTT
jgi:hypothetical protein